MTANEYRDLEKRQQVLEQSPPSVSDILDLVANVARSSTRLTKNSGGYSNRGFQGRRQGRVALPPGRTGEATSLTPDHPSNSL